MSTQVILLKEQIQLNTDKSKKNQAIPDTEGVKPVDLHK
jgi:hypothetical protein